MVWRWADGVAPPRWISCVSGRRSSARAEPAQRLAGELPTGATRRREPGGPSRVLGLRFQVPVLPRDRSRLALAASSSLRLWGAEVLRDGGDLSLVDGLRRAVASSPYLRLPHGFASGAAKPHSR